MRRCWIVLLSVALGVWIVFSGNLESESRLECVEAPLQVVDIDGVLAEELVPITVPVTNLNPAVAIEIDSLAASCDCVAVVTNELPQRVQPSETLTIRLSIKLKPGVGIQRLTLRGTQGERLWLQEISVRYHARPPLVVEPEMLQDHVSRLEAWGGRLLVRRFRTTPGSGSESVYVRPPPGCYYHVKVLDADRLEVLVGAFGPVVNSLALEWDGHGITVPMRLLPKPSFELDSRMFKLGAVRADQTCSIGMKWTDREQEVAVALVPATPAARAGLTADYVDSRIVMSVGYGPIGALAGDVVLTVAGQAYTIPFVGRRMPNSGQ
jgi:hypothetical protein